MSETNPIIIKAEFNPIVRTYILLYIGGFLALTVFGIPLAIIWFLGVGQWYSRHYFDKLECELTDRTLHFKQGILFQVEKTIPLENIQDLTFIEGPVLRYYNLCMIRVETAGQSAHASNQMSLVGLKDAQVFRATALQQRQLLMDNRNKNTSNDADKNNATLLEIKELLQGINDNLKILTTKNK